MFWRNKCGLFGKQLEKNIEALIDGDRRSIPGIFCVFAENNDRSKFKAAKVLSGVLGTLSFDEIIQIDRQMRQMTSFEWEINWRDVNINKFFTDKMSAIERRAIIIFASFNSNGFIREQAVDMMKNYEGTASYIMLRQNDWVFQVRQAAALSFHHRLQNLSAGELLAALPFADKLRWCSRDSHAEYIEMFFTVLTSPAHEHDLLEGLESKDIRTRRICINALLSHNNIKLAFEQLIREPEPFLRAALFKHLRYIGQKMDGSINRFLNDKYHFNRMLAFQYILDENIGDVYDTAKRLLLDRSATIREVAQKFIKNKQDKFDFRDFYLNNLKQNTVAAICGLSEKGLPQDTIKIEKYLQDTCIKIVKSSMILLMRLNSEKFSSVITEMLADNRLGVIKTARNLVLKYRQINYERVKEIFDNSLFQNIKLNCADILFSGPKWSRLVYMLEVMTSSEETLREKSLKAIVSWLLGFNRSYAPPPNETQKAKIRDYVEILGESLPINIQKEILFTLL